MVNTLSIAKAPMTANSQQRGYTLAAIDMGTNSIHMVVVQIDPDLPAFVIVDREKETVRLGDRDPETGNLKPEVMQRALNCLRRFLGIAEGAQATQVVALATSAVREAPNGQAFLQRIRDTLNLEVDLISGQEEARRIYLGVLSGMEFNRQPHIIIDIGGGSTELILGDGGDPRVLNSTRIGAVRLTHEFITNDPISDEEFAYLRAYIRGMMERPVEEVQASLNPYEHPVMVGTSGTIETLATIHSLEKNGTEPTPLTGYSFSRRDLEDMVGRFRKLSYAERMAVPGINDRRAEIILAGSLILLETMTLLGLESLTACDRALREGAIVDWMLTHGLISNQLRYHSSVRSRSVLKVAQRYQVHMESSDRITNFALSLFDRTRNVLHEWTATERELLWAASILHNCGYFISHNAHHKHSYYLIRHSELLGYTETEIEVIANIARYHRKSPPKKKHDPYRNLPSKRHRRMVSELSAMLRIAIALDRRKIGAIAQLATRFDASSRQLFLDLTPTDPTDTCELELWHLACRKDVFEQEFNLRVVAQLLPASATVA